MNRPVRIMCMQKWTLVFCLCLSLFLNVPVFGGDAPERPEMPAHWVVQSDLEVPANQVQSIGAKLGAQLSSIRNTVYDVTSKRVQLNVIVAADKKNADQLMARLRSMKPEEALLQKGVVVYEFVGQNDVLGRIAEGRTHLHAR